MEFMMHAVREAYGTLLKKKVPHTIRTRKNYEAYLAEVRNLMTTDRTRAETEYLNLLVTLVEAYERANIKAPAASPLDVLHELMEARGVAQVDFAKLVGSSGTASEIYNGKRAISVALAKKLANHFGVSFALFL
jgi:HTH-type transcriptional regulator/antitoxin HigA